MRHLRIYGVFSQSLWLPAITTAIVFAFLLPQSLIQGCLFTLAFTLPLYHFLIYDLVRKNEYMFYHNLGYNKMRLWLSTLSISALFLIAYGISS